MRTDKIRALNVAHNGNTTRPHYQSWLSHKGVPMSENFLPSPLSASTSHWLWDHFVTDGSLYKNNNSNKNAWLLAMMSAFNQTMKNIHWCHHPSQLGFHFMPFSLHYENLCHLDDLLPQRSH
jgi:hypothetical protein